MTITAALILIMSATYYLLRPRQRSGPASRHSHRKFRQPAHTVAKPRGPYQATSIRANSCGCHAVKVLGKQRFLTSGTVPKLPLPECSASTCDCRYVRHADRRTSQGDRRALYSLQTDLYTAGNAAERRSRQGRRESDRAADAVGGLDYSNIRWSN